MVLYNSLTKRKEEFIPLKGKNVSMYVCGVTPYDTTHLGHAFTYIAFDVVYRFLEYKGYDVNYTQNVTDIDDDILKKAKEVKKNWIALGNFWTVHFLNDMKALNYLAPTHYVKATESIDSMIQIIEVLIKKGFAYQKDENVYFEVSKFKDYGKLSELNKDLMVRFLKERGGNPNDPLKRDPLDFLLWQKAENKPYWSSPYGSGRPALTSQGRGRPGWHIECTAMINKYLGEQIDIHGGGTDLKFPHHDSEIAQGESYSGKKPYSKYWMHTGTVLFQGEKMAKSLGNLVMVSDLLKKYSSNAVRYTLLSHHYRLPWEYNELEFVKSQEIADYFENNLKEGTDNPADPVFKKFIGYMDDDFDTPKVLELLTNNKSSGNKSIKKILEILGFKFK